MCCLRACCPKLTTDFSKTGTSDPIWSVLYQRMWPCVDIIIYIMDQEVFFLYLFSCVTVRQVALFYLYYSRACGPVLTSYIMDQDVFFLYLFSCVTVRQVALIFDFIVLLFLFWHQIYLSYVLGGHILKLYFSDLRKHVIILLWQKD
jgi:hypothetical protein